MGAGGFETVFLCIAREPPFSASWLLGLKACNTTPGLPGYLNWWWFVCFGFFFFVCLFLVFFVGWFFFSFLSSFCLFCFLWDRVSLCIPAWPGTLYTKRASNQKLTFMYASHMLGMSYHTSFFFKCIDLCGPLLKLALFWLLSPCSGIYYSPVPLCLFSGYFLKGTSVC